MNDYLYDSLYYHSSYENIIILDQFRCTASSNYTAYFQDHTKSNSMKKLNLFYEYCECFAHLIIAPSYISLFVYTIYLPWGTLY